jgi:hypothetical protein
VKFELMFLDASVSIDWRLCEMTGDEEIQETHGNSLCNLPEKKMKLRNDLERLTSDFEISSQGKFEFEERTADLRTG